MWFDTTGSVKSWGFGIHVVGRSERSASCWVVTPDAVIGTGCGGGGLGGGSSGRWGFFVVTVSLTAV